MPRLIFFPLRSRMIQRLSFMLFCFCFLFSSDRPGWSAEGPAPFRRGLFVSVIQNPPVLTNRSAISRLVEDAVKTKSQVLFVQIYYANRAWFPSKVGDPTPYEECLKNVGEDPLALLIREAHQQGIQVHAWLNLMSLNNNKNAPLLKKYGPNILTRDRLEKKTLDDYKIDRQFFLEPGDFRVQAEILKMVGEVVSAYPALDGVQFDYIRYPDNHPVYGHAPMNVERFKNATGATQINDEDPLWQNWKRSQVTAFVKQLVQQARSVRPGIQVSATGCMPYARAYFEAFQDWPAWVDQGIVDFVTLMNYSPDPAQFERWNLQAKTKTKDFSKINIGVGAYKLLRLPEVFKKEFESCEKSEGGGCVVFHYGSLLENPALLEPLILNRAE